MDSSHKILNINKLLLEYEQKANVVFCHGHFNILHPGHLRFLQYAKSLGDFLVVGILENKSLDSNQRANSYDQHERAIGVASLEMVDSVVVIDKNKIPSLMSKLNPSTFLLGEEFEEKNDASITEIITSVKKYGGKVVFGAGDIHYAKIGLSENLLEDIEKLTIQKFIKTCARNDINFNILAKKIDTFNAQNLIVIGDSIVDQYIACDAVGMSAEAPVLVVKELESKQYIGGAGIVASHVSQLGANCHFLSVVGNDDKGEFIKSNLHSHGVKTHLFVDETRQTTYKIRYLVENQKLFRVSRLSEHSISKVIEDEIVDKVLELADSCDGIIISDYVYGVITERLLNKIIELSIKYKIKLFGDLQCSSQVGNVAKFKKFDLITPTEKEARISLANHDAGIESVVHQLLNKTQAKNLILKLGADGFISYFKDRDSNYTHSEHFSALVSNPVDVAGAGDSLLASIAISICSDISVLESSAIGACVAALAVQTIGNIAVPKQQLKDLLLSFADETNYN